MKQTMKAGVILAAGIALGVGTVQGLRAQAERSQPM